MKPSHCFTLVFLGFSLGLSVPVWSGGSIKTLKSGEPLKWDMNAVLVYNLDEGGLKPNGAFDSEASLELIEESFSKWISVPGVLLQVEEGEMLLNGENVDETNYSEVFGSGTENCYPEFFGPPAGPCLSAFVFDHDGAILDSLFGKCARFTILGFAGPLDVDDGSEDPARAMVRQGQALFSGACIPDSNGQTVQLDGCGPCQRVLTEEEVRTIVTHEIGHFLCLDHAQVDPDAFDTCQVNPGGCPVEAAAAIPTMFPVLVEGATMAELNPDDMAYMARMYGSTRDTCSVSGHVYASDMVTPLRGAEVVAININPSFVTDRIAFVSGAQAPRFTSDDKVLGNCIEECGKYTITGLTPGQTYQLCAQKIKPEFNGGSSIEPVNFPFQGFNDTCPDGLTVTCNCSNGPPCPQFINANIMTNADPEMIQAAEPTKLNNEQNASGIEKIFSCSLQKLVSKSFWRFFQKTILKSF